MRPAAVPRPPRGRTRFSSWGLVWAAPLCLQRLHLPGWERLPTTRKGVTSSAPRPVTRGVTPHVEKRRALPLELQSPAASAAWPRGQRLAAGTSLSRTVFNNERQG